MNKKIILFLTFILCSSCSISVVWTNKIVVVEDGKNKIDIKGSDLEGNKASQAAKGDFKLP